MPRSRIVQRLLDSFRTRRPIRAGSLIVTVFGDSIAQHGNSVWLGSLIEALAPFGLNQRLVRTAVYRLCKDDWLAAERIGRRSFYRFSAAGRSHYQKAARRIYQLEPVDWDGTWTVVLPGDLRDKERDALRRELQWLGFGTLVPGLMAHPSSHRRSLDETLAEMGFTDRVVVLNARTEDLASERVMGRLAWDCWNLGHLDERYRNFLSEFRPALKAKTLSDPDCFQLRTLLIHEYRKILLRDADLPEELLPAGWSGWAAGNLCRELYQSVHAGAESFIHEHMLSQNGAMPPASQGYYRRFGGLGRRPAEA